MKIDLMKKIEMEESLRRESRMLPPYISRSYRDGYIEGGLYVLGLLDYDTKTPYRKLSKEDYAKIEGYVSVGELILNNMIPRRIAAYILYVQNEEDSSFMNFTSISELVRRAKAGELDSWEGVGPASIRKLLSNYEHLVI